jgi:hypothetical protein
MDHASVLPMLVLLSAAPTGVMARLSGMGGGLVCKVTQC